jgi:hypothetical protein
MADGEIELDTGHLRRGGRLCGDAADSMRKAARVLAGAGLDDGIFGGLAEAKEFHAKLSDARQRHQERLEGHHAALSAVSKKAGLAARVFDDTDESAASEIGSAGEALG